jgi:putative membrane protein
MERLLSSALPFAYKLHLQMTIYIFLLCLPFQIVASLRWLSIPATVLTAFFYLDKSYC